MGKYFTADKSAAETSAALENARGSVGL